MSGKRKGIVSIVMLALISGTGYGVTDEKKPQNEQYADVPRQTRQGDSYTLQHHNESKEYLTIDEKTLSGAYSNSPLRCNWQLDPSFDSDGTATTILADFELANALRVGLQDRLLPQDRKIILAGACEHPDRSVVANGVFDASHICMARYHTEGTGGRAGALDLAFGNQGIVSTDFSDPLSFPEGVRVTDIGIQIDNKIVLLASTGSYPALSSDSPFIILRYNVDGSLDPTFDGNSGQGNGIVINNEVLGAPEVLAVQSNGKIIAAGWDSFPFQPNDKPRILIVRYNANGTLDTSFKRTGILKTSMDLSDKFSGVRDMAVQADRKIVVLVERTDHADRQTFYLMRFNEDGSWDTGFDGDSGSGNGIVPIQYSPTHWWNEYGIALQPNGSFVVMINSIYDDQHTLLRYQADGRLDTSFGNSGITVGSNIANYRNVPPTDERYNDHVDSADDVLIDNQGRILVKSAYFISRYEANGTPDLYFGRNGMLLTRLSQNWSHNHFALQPWDGKILSIPSSRTTNSYELERYACPDPLQTPYVEFTTTGQSIREGETATVTVELSQPAAQAVSVPVTFGGTAFISGIHLDFTASGTNFTVAPPTLTLTIPAGGRTASTTVFTLSDSNFEVFETIFLQMGQPTGATQGWFTTHSIGVSDPPILVPVN